MQMLGAQLRERIPAIVERFVKETRARAAVLTATQIRDHIAEYLTELARALESGAPNSVKRHEAAIEHGRQRWYVGYDLEMVIDEYAVLQKAVLDELEATGRKLDAREYHEIVAFLHVGLRDAVSEHVRREKAEIEQALERAKAATEAREDVLALVSHDLRGPLRVIAGSAGLLLDQLKEQRLDAVALSVQRIERATNRMDGLIDTILDLAKVKAGELALTMADYDALALLGEAADHALPIAEHRGVKLEVGGSGGVVRCDRTRVLQVLSNLLQNAIKFSPREHLVELSATPGPSEWTFSVSDRGQGISEEDAARVFERFWRADKKSAGTGLGLFIAKLLVELHQGRIWLESTPGRGSTFFFTIPNAERKDVASS